MLISTGFSYTSLYTIQKCDKKSEIDFLFDLSGRFYKKEKDNNTI